MAQKVVDDNNKKKPNPAVLGAPNEVSKNPIQESSSSKSRTGMQKITLAIKSRLKIKKMRSGGPIMSESPFNSGGRPFKPQYGATHKVENVDSEYDYHTGYLKELPTRKIRGELQLRPPFLASSKRS